MCIWTRTKIVGTVISYKYNIILYYYKHTFQIISLLQWKWKRTPFKFILESKFKRSTIYNLFFTLKAYDSPPHTNISFWNLFQCHVLKATSQTYHKKIIHIWNNIVQYHWYINGPVFSTSTIQYHWKIKWPVFSTSTIH